MTPASLSPAGQSEGLRADLAAATYRVAKRHGFKRAFIDIELDLWDAHAGAQGSASSRSDVHLTLAAAADY